MSIYQCAPFQDSSKHSHLQAVHMIGRYLKDTRAKGIILKPNYMNSFECWVGTDFAGN